MCKRFSACTWQFFCTLACNERGNYPHPLCSLQWQNKNEGDTIYQNKSISMLSQHKIIKFPLSKLRVCAQVPYLTLQQCWLSAALVLVLQQQSWTSSSHCICCISNYTGYTLRATVEVQAKSVALVSQEVTSAQRMQTMTNVCASVHSWPQEVRTGSLHLLINSPIQSHSIMWDVGKGDAFLLNLTYAWDTHT